MDNAFNGADRASQRGALFPRVRIMHPERQHSHELALALNGAGMLERYIHGAPLPPHVVGAIPLVRRSRMALSRFSRAITDRMLPRQAAAHAFYRSMWAFDRLTAYGIGRAHCDAVVAYENSSLHTFRAARKAGIGCILDHAGVHHALQDRMFEHRESAHLHRLIVERKDEELALADVILVCSTFAAESFAAAGVPGSKLRVLPLGCELSAFTPHSREPRDASQPVHFLFVGQVGPAKGADLIAAAAEKLRAAGIAFSLSIAGAIDMAESALLARLHRVANVLGRVPHSELPGLYAEADCLVHPSRFDSFAFVVAEALASGKPVIVSDNVGAKDMVAEGSCGWIVPTEDVEVLTRRMRWCAENKLALRAMTGAARSRAEDWSWSRYHEHARTIIIEFFRVQRTEDRLEFITKQNAQLRSPNGAEGRTLRASTFRPAAEALAC